MELLGTAGNQPQHGVYYELHRQPRGPHFLLERVAQCIRPVALPGRCETVYTNGAALRLTGNYATVTEYKQGAVSNYNGLTFSLRHQFSHWVSAHLNYTWSHNIDETSNGGLFTMDSKETTPSWVRFVRVSLRTDNYGNSDYDVRHLVNGDFVFNPSFHTKGALKYVAEGWQFSGKAFWRTGLPYTIYGRQPRRSHRQWWGHDPGYGYRQRTARRLRQGECEL